MELERVVALVALCWLIVAFLLMARSIRWGRRLADALAERHPETYEALGQPRPGFFHSVRRDRFARFVGRREFADVVDPTLAIEFERYRRTEARLVVGLLASMLAVFLLVLHVQQTVP